MNATASIFFQGHNMVGIASIEQLQEQALADGFLLGDAFHQSDAEFQLDVAGSISAKDVAALLEADAGREPNVAFLKSLFQAGAPQVTHLLPLQQA